MSFRTQSKALWDSVERFIHEAAPKTGDCPPGCHPAQLTAGKAEPKVLGVLEAVQSKAAVFDAVEAVRSFLGTMTSAVSVEKHWGELLADLAKGEGLPEKVAEDEEPVTPEIAETLNATFGEGTAPQSDAALAPEEETEEMPVTERD